MVASVQLLRKPTFHACQSLEEKGYCGCYGYTQSSLTNETLQPVEIIVLVYYSIDVLDSKYPKTLQLV